MKTLPWILAVLLMIGCLFLYFHTQKTTHSYLQRDTIVKVEIGKRVKGSSFKGCVSYVLSNKEAKILACEGVLETDTKSIINSFYMQSLLNPKLGKCVGHIPLAFSPDDKDRMSDLFMERLAKEYNSIFNPQTVMQTKRNIYANKL